MQFEKTRDQDSESSVVRVLVVGDAGVGKTSLISTLVSQHFSERVPELIHEVQIPAEESPENVVTYIMDSESRSDARQKVISQISVADVIIVVHDASRPETFSRASSYWLPMIESTKKVPVILVGNKMDLRSNSEQAEAGKELQRQVVPILKQFKFVETCLECSAKAVLNIQQVFYFAQKAVVYPIAPLFNIHTSQLEPKFENVLKRIFRIFDVDRDGILSDAELNQFQAQCFGVQLQPDEVAGLHKLLSKEIPQGVIPGRGISLAGFCHLHKQFIEKNRPETSWQVLRSFGYSDKLELSIPDDKLDIPHHTSDQSIELSTSSIQFLTDLFNQFDADGDGVLTKEEIEEIFSICPNGSVPWLEDDRPSVGKGGLSMSGWLAQWSVTTLLDVESTLTYLFYLGYQKRASTAIDITRGRRYLHSKKYIRRNVIRCFVFGATHSGKTSILDAFLHKTFSGAYYPTKSERSVANAVRGATGNDTNEKYLVLSEFRDSDVDDIIKDGLVACDVICFVFGPSDASFSYVEEMQARIPDHIPCVYVCAKSDLVPQDYESASWWRRAVAHCASLQLDNPILASAKTGEMLCGSRNLFTLLSDTAQFPDVARPITEAKRKSLQRWQFITNAMKTTLAISTLAMVSYLAYTYGRSHKK